MPAESNATTSPDSGLSIDGTMLSVHGRGGAQRLLPRCDPRAAGAPLFGGRQLTPRWRRAQERAERQLEGRTPVIQSQLRTCGCRAGHRKEIPVLHRQGVRAVREVRVGLAQAACYIRVGENRAVLRGRVERAVTPRSFQPYRRLPRAVLLAFYLLLSAALPLAHAADSAVIGSPAQVHDGRDAPGSAGHDHDTCVVCRLVEGAYAAGSLQPDSRPVPLTLLDEVSGASRETFSSGTYPSAAARAPPLI